jgi:FAD/FMN-containing dehydrogenase
MAIKVNWKKEQKLKRISREWTIECLLECEVKHKDLESLELQLVGRVVLRGTPSYEACRQGKGLSSQQAYPKIIVYCEVFNDVWLCLKWAHKYNFWVTCRSGGHSTANYSVNGGMVIDVSGLSYVVVDRDAMKARIGAGTQFHEFNSMLDTYKVHAPSVAGYMLGGGYGFTSREFGIQSDCVVSVTMMLSDGNIVVADSKKNRDLFWAVRGGTGDNFGVLLEVTYKLYPLHEIWGFVLQWPIDQAADAYVALQNDYMKEGASSRLGYQLILTYTQKQGEDPKPILAMAGMYHGTWEEGIAALDKLMNVGEPVLSTAKMGTYKELNDALMDFLPGIPQVSMPVYEEKNGGYIAKSIDKNEWQQIVDVFKKSPSPSNIAYCEVYGGVINSYPVDQSAFIHRNVYADLYIDSFWSEDPKLPDEKSAKEWLDAFMHVLSPHLSGHKYQNYPKGQFADFRWAYWGDAYYSLLFVKQKYDPGNFFHFEQSITPYPEDEAVTRSEAPSMFSDMEIIVEPYSGSFR